MIDQRTHWDDCWRERSHHDCAVARIESLLMELASQSVPINMDEFRPMTPSEHVKVNNALRARIAELERENDALHAELDGTRAELAQAREERDKARLYCAEVASYICDPMYDKVENRAGIAADAEAMATGEMTGRYLDIKTQTDRAIKAEAERDALRASVRRLVNLLYEAKAHLENRPMSMCVMSPGRLRDTITSELTALDAARAKETT